MNTQLQLGDIAVEVVRKDVKNIHLSVYPPTGRVRIAAPQRMKLETIRVFAISKLAWIKQQQKKLRTQARETPREYLDRESHHVWGTRYLLRVLDTSGAATVTLRHRTLDLRIRSEANPARRQAVLDAWYRRQLKAVVPDLIAKWAPRMGVTVDRFFVQKMKTQWGSCNTDKHTPFA
jgi:predicted metal-dependent hydrolase